MDLAEVIEATVTEVAAETLPLLVLSVSVEASTSTAGDLCVSGNTPTEVIELAELMGDGCGGGT